MTTKQKQKQELAEQVEWLGSKLADPSAKNDNRYEGWQQEFRSKREALVNV